MHIVTMSLCRAEANAANIDEEVLAQSIMATDGPARVEHARVVVSAFRVRIVMFLLARTSIEACASAPQICRLALESAGIRGWSIELHP